jgi:hypothetical protein
MSAGNVNWDEFDSRTGWIIKAAVGDQGTQSVSLASLRVLTPRNILEVPSVGQKRGRLAWIELQRILGEDRGPFTQETDGPLSWESFDPRVRWIVQQALRTSLTTPVSLESLRAITPETLLSVRSVGSKRARTAWEALQRVIAKEEGRSRRETEPSGSAAGCVLPPLPNAIAPCDLIRLEDLDPSFAWAVKRLFLQNGTHAPRSFSLAWLMSLDTAILQSVGSVGESRANDAVAYISERSRSRSHPSRNAEELRDALTNSPPQAAATLDTVSVNAAHLPADVRGDFEKVLAGADKHGEGVRWILTASVNDLCAVVGLDGPTAERFERRRDECFSHRLIAAAIRGGGDHRLTIIAVFMSVAMSGETRWSSRVWEGETGLLAHEVVPMSEQLMYLGGVSAGSDEWSYIKDVEMLDEVIAGATLAKVGARHGLTRERVRQRIYALGYVRNIDRAAIRTRRSAEDAKIRQDAENFIRRHPGCTPAELSSGIGVSIERARQECNHLHWLTLSDTQHPNGYMISPRSQLAADRSIKALQQAATMAFPLTKADYDDLREQKYFDGPSSARMLQIFGSWRKACDAAGVESGKSARQAGSHRRWSRDEFVETVAQFLVDPRFTGRADQYDQWRKSHPASADLPSASSTLNNLRIPWSQIRDRALRLTRSKWVARDEQLTGSPSGR